MATIATSIWGAAQYQLSAMLNKEMFNLWFAPLRAISLEGGVLTLEVANDFCEMWLKENYVSLLQEVLAKAAGKPLKVKFQVNPGSMVMSKPDCEVEEPQSKPELKESGDAGRKHTFNPRNTFETFVVGDNSTFAHAAALAVAQAPGKSYNPLFIYGGVGLGKTHLLHAIGQRVLSSITGARVTYVSSEKFTNEFIDAIQNNQVKHFRKKFRQVDMILIDDIQFLAGKERIQEEFFHTFNTLHESHKQIVLTCDRPAVEIQGLEQRLVSRFEWGLVTDLQPPDMETRLAILRTKEKLMGSQVPEEILSFLSQRIHTNIRRLEGALVRVASYASLTGKELTLEVVELLLREVLHEEGNYAISIEVIQKKVAEHFDIHIADMASKRRPESVAFPRHIAMYLSRHMTDQSLACIGDAFGGRDHCSVLRACRLVEDRMSVDTQVQRVVSYLEKQLVR